MDLLVATLRYPPYVAGGYELLTRDTVEGLRARGHRVTVLAGRGERYDPADGVLPWLLPGLDGEADLFAHAHRAGNRERWRLHVLRRANRRATERALATSGAELLVFFNLGLVSLAPILAARLAHVPTLGFVSDPWPLNHWLEDWRRTPRLKPLRRVSLEFAWRAARRAVDLGPLLVPSRWLEERLVRDGIPAASVRRLPLCMSPEMEALARGCEPRRRAAGEPLRVVSASSLWEGKGVHVLLAGAALAAERGAALELEIVGGGEPAYVERLEELARAPALAGRVRFSGQLSRQDLSAAMARAHVLAFPSLWGEPFALTPLEAMGHGLVPIASAEGGTPEQIEHDRTGLLVPAGDAAALGAGIARLAADEDLRWRLAQGARAQAFACHGQARFLTGFEAELLRVARGDAA